MIKFYNISSRSLQKSIPVLLKSPEVRVNGHLGFKQSNFDPYSVDSIPLDYEGGLKTILGFIDITNKSSPNVTKIKYRLQIAPRQALFSGSNAMLLIISYKSNYNRKLANNTKVKAGNRVHRHSRVKTRKIGTHDHER